MSSPAFSGRDLASASGREVDDVFHSALRLIASLKLTITMFLLGMVVVFVGSLAQARRDVWLVVDQYFRTFVAWIDVADLFPPAMFPGFIGIDWDASLGSLRYIPFPGGWTIGWILLANLVAAHYLRFKIRASGSKLIAGTSIMAIGGVLTWAVVFTGNQQTGVESGDTLLSPLQIWYLMLGVLGISAVIPLATAFIGSSATKYERILMGITGGILGSVLLYFVIGGEEARLNLSSMRILWQLLKGTACAMVILVGSNLLFAQRGGIVVLHIGVALLMFSELQVGFYAKENLLTMAEGEKTSFMRDVRSRELAIMTRDGDKDKVVAIPQDILEAAASQTALEDRVIDYAGLPFRLRVDQFLRNSALRARLPDDEKLATTGLGTFATPVERDPVNGMESTHDMSAVQITLIDKKSGDEIQTLLCAQEVSEMRAKPIAEVASVNETDFQFYLRFKRSYKDYEVELLDTSRTNYIGTSTPRDYRSRISIRDAESDESEEFTVWMNNPLRYKGETFYQSGHNELPDGTGVTTLSVVRNTGWMLPYIACMILAVGMFAHFGKTLGRYLARFEKANNTNKKPPTTTSKAASNETVAGKSAANFSDDNVDDKKPLVVKDKSGQRNPFRAAADPSTTTSIAVTLAVVILSIGWLGSKLRVPAPVANEMDVNQFANLPVAWKGRPQPIQSFARSELLMMSHKSTFKGELAPREIDEDFRKNLQKRIKAAWPDKEVNFEELADFNGEYTEWITKIATLTSSGKSTTEERVRDLFVRRMDATRWLLDVVAKPERGERHRVIRIDNDEVLSLLSLEKRPGLTYSPSEIKTNLDNLQKIYRSAVDHEMKSEKHLMTPTERRVLTLFQNVGRVEALRNMFLIDRTETLTESIVQTWWVLKRLGNTQAIMAIPTDSDNEQRSWETLLASSAVYNMNMLMKEAGVSSREEWDTYFANVMPRKMVTDTVRGSYQILKSHIEGVAKSAEREVGEMDLQNRAKDAASSELFQNQPYMQQVFQLIADAPAGASEDEIIALVADQKFQEIASERTASEVFRVFEELNQDKADARLKVLRSRLRALPPDDAAAITTAMNSELLKITMDDLDKRVGGLIYSDDSTELFEKSTAAMVATLTAWQNDDVKEFNASVANYGGMLSSVEVSHLSPDAIRLESTFNHIEPLMKSMYLYFPVLLFGFFSWIMWSKPLRQAGFWLMVLAFVVHTVALGMRMYISGRPPVTNLYSSAIFIGWAVVGACFIVEPLLKNGIGNIIGSSVGISTLMIAHYLARDEGDTLGVMQAVLDTTFWLATHVVCITLGYAATFLAGAFGIAYCLNSKFGADTKSPEIIQLGKITYGILCFALFFSLIGTILGGLWADDSWGRFWGWDPKENGAMLIVMWNAVIMHARWDKMIRDYGTAVLAIFGNIVTAWSWFGVNELSAGLHNYGFTEGRLLALIVFVGIQLAFIAIAIAPVMIRKAAKDSAAA